MNIITIFRVQSDDNRGPFRDYTASEEDRNTLTDAIPNLDMHPLVCNDMGWMSMPFGVVCGAISLRMLRHWFPTRKTVDVLENMGMHICAYKIDADDVSFGRSGTQLAFDPMDAISSKKLPISRLLTKHTREA